MTSLATPERRSEARVVKEGAGVSKRRSRPVKRKSGEHQSEDNSKRKRTFDDFFNFCSFVLAYEEELERQAMANGSTPLTPPHPPNTTTPHTHHTSSSSSGSSDSGEGEEGMCDGEGEEGVVKCEGDPLPLTPPPEFKNDRLEYTSEDESWNLVTCFCRRPFAGRPMIECSCCGTWVHLFCAKIRKDEVPDVYICPNCQSQRGEEGRERGGRKGRRRTSKDS